MSRFPLQTEQPHTAEFILSEATGNRSRDNANFADPSTVKVGQPCKKTAGATTDTPATYVLATVGADCQAIAIYGGSSTSGESLRIAVLARDCEVNGRLVNWGNMSPAEQVIGATTLETKGIIVRI